MMYGWVCLYGWVYIQKIVIDMCFHSCIVVSVKNSVVWVGHHECTEFVFDVDGDHLLSVSADPLW